MPEFALDLGYKFWFTKYAGLNVGYQLEVPLEIYAGDDKVETDSAIANRFYLGLCINFGKRYTSSN